jgi:thiol-disulfide isomerase/thioredoxin
MTMLLILPLAFLPLAGCGQDGTARTAGGKRSRTTFQVPREWQEATGFEASPVGSEEPYLVYQSRDFQNLLVIPPGTDSAWVLALPDKRVFAIPRGRVSLTGVGADVTSAQPVERGAFAKTGADIVFQAGEENIRVYPWAPLVGEVPLTTLLVKKKEYAESAAEYTPDSVAVRIVKGRREPAEIMVFFGTWCSTCRKHLPELIRVLEDADNPALTARFIAVDENLTNPRDLIDRFEVHTTPTVVVLAGTREIGRIAGLPKTTMDRDLAAILGPELEKSKPRR